MKWKCSITLSAEWYGSKQISSTRSNLIRICSCTCTSFIWRSPWIGTEIDRVTGMKLTSHTRLNTKGSCSRLPYTTIDNILIRLIKRLEGGVTKIWQSNTLRNINYSPSYRSIHDGIIKLTSRNICLKINTFIFYIKSCGRRSFYSICESTVYNKILYRSQS